MHRLFVLVALCLASAARAQQPVNDHFADAVALTPPAQTVNTYTGSGNNAAATGEPGEPLHGSALAAQSSIWFKWTATGPGTIVVDTFGSAVLATSHAIYTGTTLATLTKVAEDAGSNSPQPEKRPVAVIADTTYFIAVGSRSNQSDRGAIRVQLVFSPGPQIGTQPVERIAAVGEAATFSVAATGPALTYQWLRQGVPLAGATSASLVIPAAQIADGGAYSVVVANSAGRVTSSTALLRGANPPPTLTTAPASRTATAGTTVTLSVAATGTGPLSYQWRRNGFPLAGATAATLAFSSVSRSDADTYDVRVADALSATYSDRVQLAVLPSAPPPAFALDPGFTANLEIEGGSVSALRRAPDGKILVAGNFNRLDGTTKPHLARLRADGTVDPTFVGANFDGAVSDVAFLPDGKLLAVGAFTRVDTLARTSVVRLLPDGSPDPGFTLGSAPSFRFLLRVLTQPDGRFLLAGDFSVSTDTGSRSHLVRFLPDGALDPTFQAAPNAAVSAIAPQRDGKLLISGSFTAIGGTPRRYVARLHADGSLDPAFDPGSGPNFVPRVKLDPQDRAYLFGSFSQFNGATVPGLIRLAADGSRDPSFTPTSFTSGISDLVFLPDGRVALGGNGLGRLTAAGAQDTTFAPTETFSDITTVLLLDDGRLLAGGPLRQYFRARRLGGLVAVAANGATDPAVPATLVTGAVSSVVPLPAGKLLVGGTFSRVDGVKRTALVRLNPNGSLDPTFTDPGANDAISSLAVQGDGRIVVAGIFTRIGGTTQEVLARLSADGALDPSFQARAVSLRSTGTAPTVVALTEGRVLFVSPNLSSFLPNQRLFARFHADGSLDSSFSLFGGSAVDGFIFTDFALLADERILYANDGSLSSGGNDKPPVLGRLLADGRADPAFTPGIVTRTGGGVNTVVPLPDGRILIGGSFTNYNGATFNRLARLLPEGAVDATFAPNLSSTTAITDLLPVADNQIFILRGGSPFGFQPPLTTALTRLNANLAIDSPLAQAFAAASAGHVAALLDDGNLLLAGERFADGSVTRQGLARTRAITSPVFISPFGGRTILAGATLNLGSVVVMPPPATGTFAYQWFKDGTAIVGATFGSYVLSAATPAAAGSYTLRVTSGSGTFTSEPAAVVVTPTPPVLNITFRSPVSPGSTLLAGTRYALTAPTLDAGSPPLAYQWSKDGVALPGETRSALFRAEWSTADSGTYRVAISNSLGAVTSDTVIQHVADTPNWEWSVARPQGNPLQHVRHLNGRFFATGVRGTLLDSTDGVTWNARRVGGSTNVGPVAFGNGTFVVLTQFGGVFTSADGASWTARESGLTDGRNLLQLGFGGGRFVATGTQGAALTSIDGIVWRTAASSTTEALRHLAFGNGRWLAATSAGQIYSSTDGETWTLRAIIPDSISQLAFGAGLFVAASSTTVGTVLTSPDGETWTRRETATPRPTVSFSSLQYTSDGFLATIGSSVGPILRSTDGLLWTATPIIAPILASVPTGIAFGNSRYVMTASAPDLLLMSGDLFAWFRAGRAEARSYNAIATDGNVAVAVGSSRANSSALVETTYDGSTWFARSATTSNVNLNDVAYGPAPASAFVAVGAALGSANGRLVRSSDGATWTTPVASSLPVLRGVRYLNGRFVAVGEGAVLTSTDGTNWTTTRPTGEPSLRQVAYGAGVYVTVGMNGVVLRSTDAATWTAVPGGTGNELNDVVFGAGKFVATAFSGEVITSPDGRTWAQRTSLPPGLTGLTLVGSRFLAFGAGSSYYLSSDGETWTPAQHGGAQQIFHAVEFRLRLIGVGASGTVLHQNLPVPAGSAPPTIAEQPASTQTVRTGQPLTITASINGTPAPTYQWLKDGAPIPGATAATLSLPAVNFDNAGSYSLVAFNPAGATTSTATVVGVGPAFQLSNLSVRTTLAAAQTLTVGFAIGGNGSSKRILVRAAGPALGVLGVSGAMADPKIEVYRGTQRISENDTWSPTLAGEFARLGAFAFPTGSRDAAVLEPLAGNTTVVASGTGPGAILVECYDSDLETPRAERLINLSARNRVGPGDDVLIAGFFLAGAGTQRLLIRAVGPTLSTFGVSAPLADPRVDVFNTLGGRVAENDNWSAGLAPEFARVGAFPLPAGSRDAAIIAIIPAGRAYTVQVSGPGTTTGEALVEIYELP